MNIDNSHLSLILFIIGLLILLQFLVKNHDNIDELANKLKEKNPKFKMIKQKKPLGLDTWDIYPESVYGFRYTQQIIPSARIGRGIDTYKLATSPLSLGKIEFKGLNGKSDVNKMLQNTYTDAFLVMHDGYLIYEQYMNQFQGYNFHLIHSLTKAIIGSLFGIFVYDGQIELDKRVTYYIPELKESAYADATVKQVLNMTTGIKEDENYYPLKVAIGWRPTDEKYPDNIKDYIMNIRKIEHHGKQFRYKTSDTNILGWILENVTRQKLETLLSKYIWEKLGVDNDASITVDRNGMAYAGGGMSLTAKDLLKFAAMIYNDGFFNGEQIIPDEWIRQCRVGNNAKFLDPLYRTLLPEGAFSNQWWIKEQDNIFFSMGSYGQLVYINRNARMIIIKFSTWPKGRDAELLFETDQAINTITKKLAERN